MLVYAYEHGGALPSSAVAVIQLVPAAIIAPLGASLADRFLSARMLTSYGRVLVRSSGNHDGFRRERATTRGVACHGLTSRGHELDRVAATSRIVSASSQRGSFSIAARV